MNMFEKDNHSRTLVLSGDITDDSVAPLIERIFDINNDDSRFRETLQEGKWAENPIRLIINTSGGGVYAANALIGAMEMSTTPIHTYVLGKAFSAGLWVAAAGAERYAHQLATFMYHEIADYNVGKIESQKKQLEHSDALQRRMDDFLISRTKITEEMIDKKSLHDLYFTAEEAAEYGVIDCLFITMTEEQAAELKEKAVGKKKPAPKKRKARKAKNES